MCRALPVEGWSVEAEPVLRGGVAATKVHVHLPAVGDDHGGHGRTWFAIRSMLGEAPLPDRVRARALAVFGVLAAAEAELHRTDPDAVHFHEVGGIDAIVDVVGTCAALELLEVDEVRCSPVTVGLGMVRAAHGVLPNPAPAVVRILAGAGATVHGLDSPVEHTTPTGAALMAGLAAGFGPLPPMAAARDGLRRRQRRSRRAGQRHAGGPRRRDRPRVGPARFGSAGRADRDERRRRDRRDAGRRGRRPAGGRRARRVDHADGHEEGPARAHGVRAGRSVGGRRSWPGRCGRPPGRSACGRRPSSAGRPSGSSIASTSTAGRCG